MALISARVNLLDHILVLFNKPGLTVQPNSSFMLLLRNWLWACSRLRKPTRKENAEDLVGKEAEKAGTGRVVIPSTQVWFSENQRAYTKIATRMETSWPACRGFTRQVMIVCVFVSLEQHWEEGRRESLPSRELKILIAKYKCPFSRNTFSHNLVNSGSKGKESNACEEKILWAKRRTNWEEALSQYFSSHEAFPLLLILISELPGPVNLEYKESCSDNRLNSNF